MIVKCEGLKVIQLSFFVIGVNLFCITSNGQETDTLQTFAAPIKKLNNLIASNKLYEALEFAYQKSDSIEAIKNYYYLTEYAYYIGSIINEIQGKSKAIEAVEKFEKRLNVIEKDSAKALRQLQLEIGSFYEYLQDTRTALDYNKKALEYTLKMNNATGRLNGLVYSNLGVYYTRLGYLDEAVLYKKRALKAYQSDENVSKNDIHIMYSSIGSSMWYQSKMDSAAYYFKEAEKILDSMEQTPWNSFYRRASLQNNLAGVYSIQGDVKGAKNAMEMAIQNLDKFIKAEGTQDIRKKRAHEFLFQAIENYGGIYKEEGDYERALELLEYAYHRKKDFYNELNTEVINAKILIAETHIDFKDYNKAETLLNEALEELKTESGYADIFWGALAYYDLGRVKEYQGKMDSANLNFETAQSLFKQSQSNSYDEIYLGFIAHVSNFYSRNGKGQKALEMAQESYNYIRRSQGSSTILEFDHLLNLAEIYVTQNELDKALAQITRAKTVLGAIEQNRNGLNQQERSTRLLVRETEVQLQLGKLDNKESLILKLNQVDEAISSLEEQKAIIYTNQNIALLLDRNQELFELAKELALKLYTLEGAEEYLVKLLNYTESALYQRIRARLNLKNNIQFADVPSLVVQRGKGLRTQIEEVFAKKGNQENVVSYFTEIQDDWESYLDSLKVEYPEYYNMRYATISAKIDDVKALVPEQKTVIRYFEIKEKMFALVFDKTDISLVEINLNQVEKQLARLRNNQFNEKQTLKDLEVLYKTLWEPLHEAISHKNVVIIPTGQLYNVSFELLIKESASSYTELAEKCLLAEHNIAYNYSALLVNERGEAKTYTQDFIAFTPGFSETMKTDYKLLFSDSIVFDKGYLKLLSQPFSEDIASNYTRVFNGNHFRNKEATKTVFIDQANEHKIIHIGTHAESNNLSPELSRLIFAKALENGVANEDNSLFTYEIYNTNLASKLTILTACETGKPSYQAGEGMISLAHAFNYAGSESILTSLWKIDEQSSAEIVSYFYDNLKEGMTKPEALRKAKLTYLNQNDGRLLQPNYWAGLVLMGDTSPLDFSKSWPWWSWLLILAAILGVTYFFRKRKDVNL